jgi:DNA invertase Pin-like site-specific DNA recombinase
VIPPPTFNGSQPYREPFVGYIRVSTYYEDKISPDIQRAAITAWAERNNKRIIDWVEDLDQTGRNFKRKIMSALKKVEDREARGIAVWRYSRFGRSRHGNALNLARLEHAGGRLESATEAADTRTAFGRLQQGMAFKFAEFESDRIGEQWQETRENRLGRGLPATGGRRWGYVWHRRRLDEDGTLHAEHYDPDETLGLVVTDLYGRIADGEPMNSACQWLGREGHLGTRGKPWRQTGLTRYLDSGFGAGFVRTHPEDCDCPPADPEEPRRQVHAPYLAPRGARGHRRRGRVAGVPAAPQRGRQQASQPDTRIRPVVARAVRTLRRHLLDRRQLNARRRGSAHPQERIRLPVQ